VTENIRLGPMVKLLPMHHPVRIIEDMCVLDHLTDMTAGEAKRTLDLFITEVKPQLDGLTGTG
jgi:hypothetical protein